MQRRLDELVREEEVRYAHMKIDGKGTFESGAPAGRRLGRPAAGRRQRRRPPASSTVGALSPEQYANQISSLTGADVVIESGGRTLTSTQADAAGADLPDQGPVEVAGVDFRVASFEAPGVGDPMMVTLLMPDRDSASPTSPRVARRGRRVRRLPGRSPSPSPSRSPGACSPRSSGCWRRRSGSAAATSRSRCRPTATTSSPPSARSSTRWPASSQARLEELQRERERLQESIRRVGQSVAAGLDRVGVLEIVVQTAVEGVSAAAGRATMRGPDDRLQEVARTGEPEAFRRALHAAEAAVIDAGEVAEIQVGGASALAAPLGANEAGDQVIGIVSVARGDHAFTPAERELFAYLTNQASVSVENVDLHETVQRQAVTDELTGLFNHRRFQEVMSVEVERARRYGHEMGLIMLDIDNFKQVNDTYGHLQGDLVLREVARVLRQSSREIDEPARYGGEEMAVALPQTDLEGAYQFAERVRRAVEALALPLPSGEGTLQVTASFGVASLAAADHADKDALVAAADAALYEAKRTGKNRTVRANGSVGPRQGVHGVASTE